MKNIEKITISNARRFGSDIAIEFGKGATIILAPNGTGKTTVFEAIEFALTGAIQRLANPPLSLIRDKQDGMDIRLDFDSGRYCAVKYRKDTAPELSGDHKLLFSKHETEEIPYLLRLTHLLEQRGVNWFVQQNEPLKAGGQLDRLPVVRDLTRISTTKTALLKAATTFVSNVKGQLDNASKELSAFMDLLQKRNAFSNDFSLVPLKEIAEKLLLIYIFLNQPVNHLEEKTTPLSALGAHAFAALQTMLDSCQGAQAQVSGLESQVGTFQSNKENIATRQAHAAELADVEKAAGGDLAETKNKTALIKERLDKARKQLAGLQELKKQAENLGSAIIRQAGLEEKLEGHNTSLPSLKVELSNASEAYNNYQALSSSHKGLRQREKELLERKGELATLVALLDEWQSHIATVSRITETDLVKLENDRKDTDARIAQAVIAFETAFKALEQSNARLEALRAASNAIAEAVGIISANLAPDEGACPVCSTVYAPPELRRRINQALESINPLLTAEIETNTAALQTSKAAEQALDSQRSALKYLLAEISRNEQAVRDATATINEKILPRFPGVTTYPAAAEQVNLQQITNTGSLDRLSVERGQLGREPTSEEVNNALALKNNLQRQAENEENAIKETEARLTQARQEIAALRDKIGDASLLSINGDIEKAEGESKATAGELETSQGLEESYNKLVADTQLELIKENAAITQMKGHQKELTVKWAQAGLSGEPDAAAAGARKNELTELANKCQSNLDILAHLREQLTKWHSADQLEQYNSDIKRICGDVEEEQYKNRLEAERDSWAAKLKSAEQNKNALNTFTTRINAEMSSVTEYMKTINPDWQALLKRVVINPRFVMTALDSYIERNKNMADVNVSLHGKQVRVMDVASEAQVTDLQLTFMLAMAKKYQWTPWKALLLDDPTQHHDLVHASAVFDLLRDYITEDDYQVLLGTHDTVHARFFQRKLQNDGIDVKVWNLIADDEGVRAECW